MAAVVSSIPETLRSTVNCKNSDVPLNDVRSHKDTSAPPNTIDELLRKRAETHPNQALLAYPKTFNGAADFVMYTARDLDRFADEVARKLQSNGLKPADPASLHAEVIALLGPSNLDYVATIVGLFRLGYACLLLSTRLSIEAVVNLLRKTKSKNLIVAPSQAKSVESIQTQYPIHCYSFFTRADYDLPLPSGPRVITKIPKNAASRTSFIIHSSGSTGLPKPIFQTHKASLTNYSRGGAYRAFLTLPLYHNHGISTFFRGIYSGNTTYFFSSNLPLSASNLLQALEAAQPESFNGVPYALKLLAETEEGIKALAKCKLVLYGGSSCPDELGDKLVEAGVYLVGHYGATEMGQLMTSFRKPDDKAWAYLRPLSSVTPYLRFVPVGTGIYECVVLSGLPTKVMSNSNDPPDSFYTKDTFVPHPNIPNAWKYLGRIDDRVTLVNGEKVLPVPYENQIRENELVQDCIIFGVGKAFPGICIIPSLKASSISNATLLDTLMPTIEAANSRVEEFSQISRDMVEIMDPSEDYPQTDKGTLTRAAFYKKFEKLIDSVYQKFETFDSNKGVSDLAFSVENLEKYLLNVFRSITCNGHLDVDTDFFAAGVDSLQGLAIRGCILRELDLGGNALGQNAVFDYPNIQKLARHIHALRMGEAEEEGSELEEMKKLVAEYSFFAPRTAGAIHQSAETIILTGTTGSLGAHLLAQIARMHKVRRIYCLVRAESQDSASERVAKALSDRALVLPTGDSKVTCLPSDFSCEDLGLDKDTLFDLRQNLTTIIHSAWAVNFNLGVRSFEQQHIKGTYNLLKICLATETVQPAKLFFCSSISVAAGTPLPAVIKEEHIGDLSHAQNMGYARSKLVTEHIIKTAVEQTGICARILRMGQIVGDSRNGIWNTTEAIPLMIQSAATIGALPAVEETLSWMPVDEVARGIVELSQVGNFGYHQGKDNPEVVYQVQNHRLLHWTRDLLPALREAGLQFETVSQREWVKRLREGEKDPNKNPTIKLLDFFEKRYDNDGPGRSGLVFETVETRKASEAVRNGYDVIGNGLIGKCVDVWRNVW